MAMKKDHKKGRGRRQKSEFDQQLLDLARVTRVVKGGRRFRFRATMVIGNRKGKVGVGVSKGTDVSAAIQKAVADAKKNMIDVNLDGNTIAHDVNQKLASAKIMMKPAKEGSGIIAGGAVRTVVNLAGVKDIVSKSYGTSNKLNVARATIEALKQLRKTETDKSVTENLKVVEKKERKKTITKKTVKKTTAKKAIKKTKAKKVTKKTTKKTSKKVSKKTTTK
jgi:small subunit ribosomal protein S5